MTFTNRLATIFPGFGQPQSNDTLFLNQNVALSGTSQQSNTIPSTGSFVPTLSRGKVRVKIYAGIGTTPTFTDLVVTGTDGTTTVTLFAFHPNAAIALSTTGIVDLEFDFICDLNLTSITIKTTLGGTSPGATMDAEVAGTI